MQFEIDTARDMKAGAEQLAQELADAQEVIAELQTHASGHQGTVDAAMSQVQVRLLGSALRKWSCIAPLGLAVLRLACF